MKLNRPKPFWANHKFVERLMRSPLIASKPFEKGSEEWRLVQDRNRFYSVYIFQKFNTVNVERISRSEAKYMKLQAEIEKLEKEIHNV